MLTTKIDIERAHQIIRGKLSPSPLLPVPGTNTPQGHALFLKAESLMPSGSFKIRGATYLLHLIPPEQRSKGVVAYSTGNHAQAVGWAAKQLGIKATIVMSPEVPEFKKEAAKSYGADIVIVPAKERKPYTEQLAKDTGAYYVPPFDHPDIIAGQGTIGLEILNEFEPSAVFVPVGGGGLIAGIALAIKKRNPKIQMIGVEPLLEDDAHRSFYSKQIEHQETTSKSIADAVRVPALGELPFEIIMSYVDDLITVEEEQIAQATLLTISKTHLMVEPAGALALAGALSYKGLKNQGPVVCIASGGNTTVPFLCGLNDNYHS